MSDSTVLEERLRSTLRAKAGQVTVGDEPFAPLARPDGAVVPLAGHRRRPGRPAWLVAAAVAAVAVLVVGLLVARGGRHSATVDQGPRPDRPGVYAPTWAPDGYQLWDISPSSGPGALAPANGAPTTELWGDDSGPRLLVQVDPNPQMGIGVTGQQVTVRGVSANTRATTIGSGSTASEGVWLQWSEGGSSVQATVKASGTAEAAAMVDGLAWRTPGQPVSGVAPDSLSGLRELGGINGVTTPATALTTFVSGTTPPTLTAGTGVELTVAGPGAEPGSYLASWFDNPSARQADGSLQWIASPRRAGPGTSGAVVMWPDGRYVMASGVGVADDDLLRMARSVAPTTDADLDARRTEITDRILALPVVASATIAPLTLEVHGDGGTALCVHAAGGPVTCGPVAGASGAAVLAPPGLVAGTVVDGDWYVAAAGTGPFAADPVSGATFDASRGTVPPSPSATTLADLPVVRQADVGPWHLLVAAMPSGGTQASVDWDATGSPTCPEPAGGSCARGLDVVRPPA